MRLASARCRLQTAIDANTIGDEHMDHDASQKPANPYTNPIWRQWILGGHHSGARRLQDLALNLYNARAWPKVDMADIARLSSDHWECAQAMLLDYRQHGENNRQFIALCEKVAEVREQELKLAASQKTID